MIFRDVTLVGVLAADVSLYAPDFAAAERTFELLVQAAGRAGRGRQAGTALIQTYMPEHYSIHDSGGPGLWGLLPSGDGVPEADALSSGLPYDCACRWQEKMRSL